VHHLHGPDLRPEQLFRDAQVRGRLGHLDNLDNWAADECDRLAWRGQFGMQHVRRLLVEEPRGPPHRHAGDHEFRLPSQGEPHRVGPGRMNPVPLDPLYTPATTDDRAPHEVEIVSPGTARMITHPAHRLPPSN
jgi:hypothetical protein